MFQLQKFSNYGTSTPAVARTAPQGHELLSFFRATEAQKEACVGVLLELKRHLVRCVEISERVSTEIAKGNEAVAVKGFDFQSHGRAVSLPGVADLHSQAEAFLQSAKLAIRETARLVEPFYGGKHDHRFHKLASWAEGQFGTADHLTKGIRSWEPWVKHVVAMRNAVDHPEDKPGGKLVVHNFRLGGTSEAPALIEPAWGLTDGPEWRMGSDMEAIIEGGIELGEEILVGLFHKFNDSPMLVVYEIPKEQRDPSFPRRLRVGLAFGPPNA